MRQEKVIIVHRLLRAMMKEMDESDVSKMLIWVEQALPFLRQSDYFSTVLEVILHAPEDIPIKHRERLAALIGALYPELNHKALIWIIGLQVAGETRDLDTLMMETCLFIAAQENGFYRVEDDRLRLALSYVHLDILRAIAIAL